MTLIKGRGYGALMTLAATLARPEKRAPGPAARPWEQDGAAWVLLLLAVVTFAGTVMIEAARFRL